MTGSRLPSFKQFDLRVTKGFAVGGLDLSAYVDARNLLNFRNVLAVFTTTNDTRSTLSEVNNFSADSSDFASEALKNTNLLADGSIDLTFGVANNPNPKASCGAWVRDDGIAAAPNCVSFIRTEERFGSGDHIFTVSKPRRPSAARYTVTRGQ